MAHDGAIATVHKAIGVLGIPFLYENHEHAWRVYDSGWLKEFSDDMVKKTGIRMLGLADNGVRHFTNSVRPIRSPADMKGMKIRIQPSPVFKPRSSPGRLRLGDSVGRAAAAAAEGRRRPGDVTNILAASLYQHQKYVTLDGHVWSIHAYLVNERFFRGLNAAQKKAVEEGTRKAIDIHRR